MGLKCQTSVGVEREGAKGCRVTICPGWSPLAPPRWELWVEGKSVFLPAGRGWGTDGHSSPESKERGKLPRAVRSLGGGLSFCAVLDDRAVTASRLLQLAIWKVPLRGLYSRCAAAAWHLLDFVREQTWVCVWGVTVRNLCGCGVGGTLTLTGWALAGSCAQ